MSGLQITEHPAASAVEIFLDAKIIGRVESNDSKKLSIVSEHGTFEY